ncbi:hypothetical protein [Streptomyces niveus]|uniref:hypothetical protein n=1 Tax=Streptomyces niveus TaxID=193462 RepID=UPI0036A60F24
MGTEKTTAPGLGDEQQSQLLTYFVGGQRSVVNQTAIRAGNFMVIVFGSPGLVDAHLDKGLPSRAPQLIYSSARTPGFGL